MQEQDQQLGSGQDNLVPAAHAVQQIARQSANAAAGAAAAIPAGAVISALWAARHTLYRVLICLCLSLVLLIVLLVSLPSIVTGSIFGMNGVLPVEGTTLQSSYTEMADAVSAAVESGHQLARNRVEQMIAEGDYDYDLSMKALIDQASGTTGYDASYILAAYSASLEQIGTTKEDMTAKLLAVSGSMFPILAEKHTIEELVPVTYETYKAVSVTVITGKSLNGIVNGIPRYTYRTATRTLYLPNGEAESDTAVNVPKYKASTFSVPLYSGGAIIGTKQETYYVPAGTETMSPTTRTIRFLQCTIQPFQSDVINEAFGLDPEAPYSQFPITCGEAISKMTAALKMTLYGNVGEGQPVPLTDTELVSFVNNLNCSLTRKQLLSTALSLVGKVPYFWGGKSEPGWNDAWNTPRLVTAAGSSTTGTIRPYGMDCSGFSDWVYKTALGVTLHAGGHGQWDNSRRIQASELLPGDLGFLLNSDGSDWTHVLIFAGYDKTDQRLWVHCTAGSGVVLNTPSYEGTVAK